MGTRTRQNRASILVVKAKDTIALYVDAEIDLIATNILRKDRFRDTFVPSHVEHEGFGCQFCHIYQAFVYYYNAKASCKLVTPESPFNRGLCFSNIFDLVHEVSISATKHHLI